MPTIHCTADLASHNWTLLTALQLSLPDRLDRIEMHCQWVCCWCHYTGEGWCLAQRTEPIPRPAVWQSIVKDRLRYGDEYAMLWNQEQRYTRQVTQLRKHLTQRAPP